MTNILRAIKTIVDHPIPDLVSYYKGRNRINSVGDALEGFVKDILANTINETDESKKMEKYNEVFSYSGNQNNPPDLIIKNGDAVKIKHLVSKTSDIKLTGSYPRARLFYDDPAIGHCRNYEEWKVKELIYIMGVSEKNTITQLWLVYGDCYFADRKIYEHLLDITDPLGVTKFNNFQKCQIANPNKVFDYLPNPDSSHQFNVQFIARLDKYYSFPVCDRSNLETLAVNNKINILDIEIKSPEKPEQLIPAKFITFSYD